MLHNKSITPADAAEHQSATLDARTGGSYGALVPQLMDALEQGIIVWAADGTCAMHNQSVLDVLALDRTQLRRGMPLAAFLGQLAGRGDTEADRQHEFCALYAAGQAFQYDCRVRPDRIVSASVRPMRGGGHVVAYTDVTAARNAAASLALAKAEAEAAQREAAEVLAGERARQHEASLLAQMDEWLQSCKSLAELYTIVTAFMEKVLPGTRGQLFIYSNSRDVLDCACAWRCAEAQDHVTPDSCWALRRGRSYSYDPDRLGFVCDHVKQGRPNDSTPGRLTCVPIVAHGDTVGLMHIEYLAGLPNPEVLDPDGFTTRCAEHISMAIANVKLRDELQDQSSRDPLTGLYNRRHFLEALRRELARTAARQGNFALLSLDADHFKTFNDDHGHDAGDVVLEAIAEKMRAIDVAGAIACRVGGEEFSVILPNADRTRASQAVEDLRQTIAESRVKYIGGPLPKVTISAGVAVYPTHGTDPTSLIKQADVALYEAKKAGRNCWRVAEAASSIIFE